MPDVLWLPLAAIGSALIVRTMLLTGDRLPLLDRPNARSSHTTPTMRGGGLAIVVVVSLVTCLEWWFGGLSAAAAGIVLAGAVLVGGIGLVDDMRDLAAGLRLVVQLLACLVVLALVGEELFSTEFAGAGLGAEVALAGLVLAASLWCLNLYNFMDGIDGLAGAEAVFVALSAAALILVSGSESQLVGLLAATGGASLGFLFYNWPPARIFMGDVGSGFLGFLLAALALMSHLEASLPIWSWLILLSVFIVDASVTLTRRLLHGERVYQAHRSHAYQHAVRRFGSHRAVTMATCVINVLWLLPLAALAQRRPEWAPMLTVTAWLPLAVAALWLGAGQRDVDPRV